LISDGSSSIFSTLPILEVPLNARQLKTLWEFEMSESYSMKIFFERNWEKMALWVILIGLFYLLKPFFLLIFETFLITYVAKGFVQGILSRVKMNYRLTVVLVFMLFLSLLVGAGAWIGPKLIVESNQLLTAFTSDGEHKTQEKINDFVEDTVVKLVGEKKGQAVIVSEQYAMIMEAMKNEFSKAAKYGLPRVLQTILHIIKIGWEILVFLVLAFIFSFILVMDWQKISGRMKELENSRIRSFYIGAAPHLRAFANILGKALRAQAVIATCNTIFTAIGLWYFEIPNIALLSTIVFLCGFIPILGTFLSSIPIMIFGIQVGGLPLVLKLTVFVAAVHAFEAYVLNPKITGDILHIHPIIILVLLLVGQRFFGIWGMIVGVPIGCYLITVLSTKEENTRV
jgi:predicted PurR-regulated permease PerM